MGICSGRSRASRGVEGLAVPSRLNTIVHHLCFSGGWVGSMDFLEKASRRLARDAYSAYSSFAGYPL